MTTIDAERFVERVRDDEQFVAELTARSDDPEAICGARLSEEQSMAIAGDAVGAAAAAA